MPKAIAYIHEQDGSYGISFPDFPGVATAARSVDEVVERGRSLLAFHVEGLVEDGLDLPQLRTMQELRASPEEQEQLEDALLVAVEVELPGKTVRVNVSLDDRLLDRIDRAAEAAGQSRSAYLAAAARDRLRGAA